MSGVISEEDVARARTDPEFRQKLLVDKLDLLLEEIARLRKVHPAPSAQQAKQIREGVDLAVKLADRLQKNARPSGPQAA